VGDLQTTQSYPPPGRIAHHQISPWASSANMVLMLLSTVFPGMIWTNLVSIMVVSYTI
jgi:hypothetical protein